jgi:hypothetical protein
MATGQECFPEDVVHALRKRALSFTVVADSLKDRGKGAAAVLREESVQLRCHAAVIEALSTLHDELGRQAQWWDEFAKRFSEQT